MRFKDIKNFKIQDLKLDKGNYRFQGAKDQMACIKKIFASNPQYFRTLLTSVAEDDLGEPLLVYQTRKENVVLDGNRRLACLKVLSDPEKYSPNETIKEFAKELIESNKIDLHTYKLKYLGTKI